LVADWGHTQRTYAVRYNPKELSLEKNVQLGEINIPGLDAPLQQFVRGQAEKLSLELFFDTTEDGMGASATSVTAQTDKIYQMVKVESDSHAPPIVTFCWNAHFPGDTLEFGRPSEQDSGAQSGSESGGESGSGNQSRNSFTGVVESIRQKFTLFSPEGVPLRATINLVLREFRPLDEQLDQLRLNSPDRTHSHALRAGESLPAVAARYYRRAGDWRHIADENDIDDPRRLNAGTIIVVPAIHERLSS
jgi:Contractile injection system tube protein